MELNHLNRLEMTWTCSVPFLRRVLVSCPSLRDLIVSALCLSVGEDEEEEEGDEDDSDDNEFEEEHHVDDPAESDDDTLDYDGEDNEECQVDMEEMKTKVFALRRFQVSTGGLFKQMPGLERLALAEMPLGRIRELRVLLEKSSFKRLTELRLGLLHNHVDLLATIPSGQLRVLDICLTDLTCLEGLLNRQAQSLEWLQLCVNAPLGPVSAILYQCVRLRELTVVDMRRCSWTRFVDYRDLFDKPWVCQDIEVLVLPVGIERYREWSSKVPPALAAAIEEDRKGPCRSRSAVAEALFQERVSELKKLRHSDFSRPRSSFKWSIPIHE
ncbi:hypothetical protein DFQ27_001598 [Actinomortierella ambigua]|uniref:Uncharacterized protein n=1 Tax=Actinomortierella ambigua TaxID=1343610 RepID=A0A9P6QC43_9FUNG|nr:hypothetical protein DFQ27_001598 [Actinomortierella ambigua]